MTSHLSHSGHLLLSRRKPHFGPAPKLRALVRAVPRPNYEYRHGFTAVFGPMGVGVRALRRVVSRLRWRASLSRGPFYYRGGPRLSALARRRAAWVGR